MTETLSIRIDAEDWQLGEIQSSQAEVDRGEFVRHERVAKWLQSWGKPGERKAPR